MPHINTHSGIKCDKAVLESFNKLHKGKSIRWVTFKIRRGLRNFITTVDQVSKSRDDTFQDFLKALPEYDPRFAVFEFSYKAYDANVIKTRPLYVYWCPSEKTTLESKTLYSATTALVHKELCSVTPLKKVEILDREELQEDGLLKTFLPLREIERD